MMLKYYGWERKEFADCFNVGLSVCESQKANNKLARHFKHRYFEEGKLVSPKLVFSQRFNECRGTAYGQTRIKIGMRTTLGVLGHEFAHLINNRNGGVGHDKKFKRCHKKVMTYIRSKNYFGMLEQYFKEETNNETR